MTADERLEVLEKELHRLGRRDRRLIACLAGCLPVAAIAWIVSPQSVLGLDSTNVQKVVRANTFIVEDGAGVVRAELGVKEGIASLELADKEGNVRVAVMVRNDECNIMLAGGEGAVILGVTTGNGPGLTFQDRKGATRVSLGATANDGSWLALTDEKGVKRIGLNVRKEGPSLILYDKKFTSRAVLGSIKVKVPDGKTVVTPESRLTLFSRNGNTSWQTP